MHMLMVMGGGVLLLGVFLLFGKLWGGDVAGVVSAGKLFVPAWLAVSITNLWVGVTKAGYTVAQELPILLAVFAVPTAVAALIVWQLGRA